MGNRAVITTAPFNKNNVGIYLHWNGGIESIEAFLGAARELGYRSPDLDSDASYGFARLTGLICLFFDITNDTSIGVDVCRNLDCDNGDNGVYLVGKDWKIVGHGHKAPYTTKPEKNPDPVKTASIKSQLIIGARLCATTFENTRPSASSVKKVA